MPTACFDPTLDNYIKSKFNSVCANCVPLCTNPCPPFMAPMTISRVVPPGSLESLWFQQHLVCGCK